MPPDVVETKGENEPCSASLTLSSYSLFFSCSFRRWHWARWVNSAQTGSPQRSGDEPVAKHDVEYTHAHKIREWRLIQRTAAESL